MNEHVLLTTRTKMYAYLAIRQAIPTYNYMPYSICGVNLLSGQFMINVSNVYRNV